MKKSVLLLLSIVLISQAFAYTFCDDGETGKSELRLISIDDMLKDNSKEWSWEPGNTIELEARVENRENEARTYMLEIIFIESDSKENIAENSNDLEKEFTLSANERKTISLEFEIDDDADLGDYELYAKLYEKGNEEDRCVENSEEKITIEKVELCEDEADKDDLQIIKIRDERKDNDEEWNWKPGDDIEITLTLENSEYSQRTFVAELFLLDENNNEIDFAEDLSNLQEEKDVEEGETEDFEFEFKLKPGLSEGDYTLYAKVYDEDNDNICTSLKAYDKSNPEIITIEKAERNVIVKDAIGPATADTYSQIQYNATIINLGSEEEKKTQVIIYNYELGILDKIEVNNLGAGEEKTVIFKITIPANASLEQHAMLFSTEFNYNEKQDYYESESDEDDDIKRHITIYQGSPSTQEEIKQEENKTIIEINTTNSQEEQETKPATTITGNAIGSTTNSTMIWAISIIIMLIILGTIYYFLSKRKTTSSEFYAQPRVARRYTAKLN